MAKKSSDALIFAIMISVLRWTDSITVKNVWVCVYIYTHTRVCRFACINVCVSMDTNTTKTLILLYLSHMAITSPHPAFHVPLL